MKAAWLSGSSCNYRLKDRRFETEGEWKNRLAGGTRGTVEALTRELREALRT
mgnify:CR=1 FL=1